MSDTVTTVAVTLIEEVLKEHFGSHPSTVAGCLLRRGVSAIFELREATKLIFKDIRNSLLTLIQHNIVECTIPDNTNEPIRYFMNVHEALLRIRYPRYALYVAQKRGTAARLLLTQIIKTGKGTLSGTVRKVIEDLEKNGDRFADLLEEQKKKIVLEKKFKNNEDDDEPIEYIHPLNKRHPEESFLKKEFVNLVADNFLIRVDPQRPLFSDTKNHVMSQSFIHPSIPLSIDSIDHKTTEMKAVQLKESTTGTTRRGRPKSNSQKSITPTSRTVKKKRLIDQAIDPALQALNDSCIKDVDHIKEQLFDFDATCKEEGLSDIKQSKNSTLLELQSLLEEIEKTNVVFKINTPFLNLQLLREMAENFMSFRWSESRLVRYLTRALLQGSRIQEQGVVITRGQTFQELRQQLIDIGVSNLPSFKIPEKNVLLQLLDTLGRTDRIIRSATRDGVPVFLFDWDRLKYIIHERLLFNAVSSRLGPKGGRVYNLLLKSNVEATSVVGESVGGQLWEDQQVADQALLPPHAARDILYRLSQFGYVRMHQSDVVTGAPTTSASKHALIFSATESIGKSQLVHDIYSMLLNVLERKQYEAKEISRLMFSVTGLTTNEDFQLRQRESGEDRLEYSFLHLDYILLMLQDM